MGAKGKSQVKIMPRLPIVPKQKLIKWKTTDTVYMEKVTKG